MKKPISSITAILFSIILVLERVTTILASEYRTPHTFTLIDMHAHFFRISPDAVVKAMDKEDVSAAVFMPVPNAGRARRRAATEQFYLEAAKAFPKRVVAFYGGNEINRQLMSTDPNNISIGQKERFRDAVEEILKKGGYKGIGELGPRHIAWTTGMQEIEDPADHPLMLALADLVAKYNVPMDIHLEATKNTISQLEHLLAYSGKAKIIWDHAGWSNTGLATAEVIGRLMTQYSNLYSSIKYRDPQTPTQELVRLLDKRGALVSTWKSLFEKFPDRFFIGTDIKLGNPDVDYRHIEGHRRILAQLSAATANKIAWKNAANVLGLK